MSFLYFHCINMHFFSYQTYINISCISYMHHIHISFTHASHAYVCHFMLYFHICITCICFTFTMLYFISSEHGCFTSCNSLIYFHIHILSYSYTFLLDQNMGIAPHVISYTYTLVLSLLLSLSYTYNYQITVVSLLYIFLSLEWITDYIGQIL